MSRLSCLFLHLIVFFVCLFHVLLRSALCVSIFAIYLDGEERAGCFTLFALLVFCDCYMHCSLALPHGVVGWSAVRLLYFPIILTFLTQKIIDSISQCFYL